MNELRIGLLGLGTVGSGVARLLLTHGELFEQRLGMGLRLTRIATLPSPHLKTLDLTGIAVSDDARAVVTAPDVDLVVELIGGYDPARGFIRTALEQGKHVVTANKALIAVHGNELLAVARDHGVELCFEAAVAGAIPILKALRESLVANRIDRIQGILNGTCNYILTEMRERGAPFAQVLQEAQAQGYAEADPSFDVDGIDTAHKLTILSALAFGTPLDFASVHIEGIRNISEVDIAWAERLNYRIKLLAIARRVDGRLQLRVHPAMVGADTMVATVEGVFNAVFVDGDFSGPTMYHGRGAGQLPTASAVVADIADVARNLRAGAVGRVAPLSTWPERLTPLPVQPIDELVSEYFLRMTVADRAGVLAEVTRIFHHHNISIMTIHQDAVPGQNREDSPVPLVLVTHATTERKIQASLAELERLEVVTEKPHLIRIESSID
ncbi:MAG: homoserine dehydrogenase [Magnetococcales bacterium]|nr:homoserine dehydrogenase [Magnetococcales bacterium]